MKNFDIDNKSIQTAIDLLEWYTLARWVVPCLNCGEFLTSLGLCPECGKRFALAELETFQDAVKNDPDMTAEQKEYWLSQEVKAGAESAVVRKQKGLIYMFHLFSCASFSWVSVFPLEAL